MKQKKSYGTTIMTGLPAWLIALLVNLQPNHAFASGGSGSVGSGGGADGSQIRGTVTQLGQIDTYIVFRN